MRYLLCWSVPPKNYDATVDAFLKGGAPMTEGLATLGRCHIPDSNRGWLLYETDNVVALSQHACGRANATARNRDYTGYGRY
jgi:hypothetical protein